jgi:hypothetical protein
MAPLPGPHVRVGLKLPKMSPDIKRLNEDGERKGTFCFFSGSGPLSELSHEKK